MEIAKITDFIDESLISLDIKAKTKEETLRELANLLGNSKKISSVDTVYQALTEREKLGSTGIGKEVAIPHAKTDSAEGLTVGFAISKKGIAFDSLDEDDVKMFFVFASPLKDSKVYLKILARISRLIRDKDFRKKLVSVEKPSEVIEKIRAEEK